MASSDASTPEDYLDELEGDRGADVRALDALIRETAPDLEPHMSNGMLGYGPYRYRYATGREGETSVIQLASQKRYISLYVCSADERGYLAEQYEDALPNADIGRSCVRFKRNSDVDLDVVRGLIAEAAELGGMSAASEQ